MIMIFKLKLFKSHWHIHFWPKYSSQITVPNYVEIFLQTFFAMFSFLMVTVEKIGLKISTGIIRLLIKIPKFIIDYYEFSQ